MNEQDVMRPFHSAEGSEPEEIEQTLAALAAAIGRIAVNEG